VSTRTAVARALAAGTFLVAAGCASADVASEAASGATSGITSEDGRPAPLSWRGYERFPSLYFAAEPSGPFSAEQLRRIARFELAIIEFRMGQFADEFDGGRWAGGDLQGLMNAQVERIKAVAGPDMPVLTYLNAKWAGTMFAHQRRILADQDLFLPDPRHCEGFIEYPLDVGETGLTSPLDRCRWDFRRADTRAAFVEMVERAAAGPADGIFLDNGHSVACDGEGELSRLSSAERESFMRGQHVAYREAFTTLRRLGRRPVLSTTVGFARYGAQVPFEDACPLPEEDLLAELDGVPFTRNNEFWMWNLGELASTQMLNTLEESRRGVPIIVHVPYFPEDDGCLEGCFGVDGQRVRFTEQEFLEFTAAAFLVVMSPGSYFGFSDMQAEPEGGGWFDESWDFHPLYDAIVTGAPVGPVRVSEDGMRFARTFERGMVTVDVGRGTAELDLSGDP